MSLTTGEMSAADLAAVVGGSRNNDGFGGFGGEGWWIILLFLCLFNGGWGNGFGGGNGGNGGFVPYYLANNTDNGVQAGFNNAALSGQLNGIQSGVQNLSTQLCNCCCDMQGTVQNGFAQAEIAANSRQMANMNQSFANQMATTQGFNAVQSQLADCCCENRLATANLGALVQSENCADRAALSDGLRDIIVNQTANTQRILDQLCNDKIDAKNEKIADLERQLTLASLRESQTAQNAFISQGFSNEVDALYNRLNSCPVPTTPVYGRTPIFTCNQNNGCGCGCGSF